MKVHGLTDIVRRPSIAKIYFIRDGQIFYTTELKDGTIYQFPIDFSEVKGGIFKYEMPAISLMRWIRKSMEDGNLIKIKER